MSITKEQKEKHLEHRRYFFAASPTYTKKYDASAENQRKKEAEEQEKRKKKLLDYLNAAKKSAIKRGMYNQKPYRTTVAEANKNV